MFKGHTLIFIATFGLFLSLSSVSADRGSTTCGEKYEVSKYFYKINTCNSDGVVLSISEFFVETGKVANTTYVDSLGRKTKRVSFSSSGDFNIREFNYSESSVVEVQYEKNSKVDIKDKLEKDLLSGKKITEWVYENGVVKWIDRYTVPNEKQITSRQFLAEKFTYHFKYKKFSQYGDEVESFEVVNNAGEAIGEYNYSFNGDIHSVLRSQFSGVELEKRINQFENRERISIGIIDSGFDLYHPSITPFLVNNPSERWGGVDYDGNGLAGDAFGWSHNTLTGESGNINETVIIGGFKPFPLSHGSHVASIALAKRREFSLYGMAGDVGNHKYLDTVGRVIGEKKLSMVNMSWGFKEQGYPQTPPIETYNSLKKVISKNPETLFFVAAGNNGWDLEGNLRDYPASYGFNNTIVIGAMNVADYSWFDGNNLIPAKFKNDLGSNYGSKSVDIFAPGKNVLGAKLGGGDIAMSGTSMASPFAMNSAMILKKALPYLTSLEIKEIILKTAGIPSSELECVSRGFVHPKRIRRVANLLTTNPSLSLEQAVLKARLVREDYYPGEVELGSSRLSEVWLAIDQSLRINEE
jgi:hypothetical protein